MYWLHTTPAYTPGVGGCMGLVSLTKRCFARLSFSGYRLRRGWTPRAWLAGAERTGIPGVRERAKPAAWPAALTPLTGRDRGFGWRPWLRPFGHSQGHQPCPRAGSDDPARRISAAGQPAGLARSGSSTPTPHRRARCLRSTAGPLGVRLWRGSPGLPLTGLGTGAAPGGSG